MTKTERCKVVDMYSKIAVVLLSNQMINLIFGYHAHILLYICEYAYFVSHFPFFATHIALSNPTYHM